MIAVLSNRPHPEQGFRPCPGILRLYRGVKALRAEAVSARAIEIGALNYRSIASIIAKNPQKTAAPKRGEATLFDHPNVRGPRYFNSGPKRRSTPWSLTSPKPVNPERKKIVLTHPTLDQLHALGLHGLAKGFKELADNAEARSLEHAEWLGLLLEYGMTLRRQKPFEMRVRTARLRTRALRMSIIARSAASTARCSSNLASATGSGTNAISSSPGHAASARVGWPARLARRPAGKTSRWSVRMARLFAALALARGDGRYAKLLRTLSRFKLLILDDWGPKSLTAEQARDLPEIMEDRFDAASTLVTSQVRIKYWHDMIGNPTLADAILDRLLHNAYRIELDGKSKQRRPRANPRIDARKKSDTSFVTTHGDTAKGGQHQIGTPSGLKSEHVSGFILECMADIIGIRNEGEQSDESLFPREQARQPCASVVKRSPCAAHESPWCPMSRGSQPEYIWESCPAPSAARPAESHVPTRARRVTLSARRS